MWPRGVEKHSALKEAIHKMEILASKQPHTQDTMNNWVLTT